MVAGAVVESPLDDVPDNNAIVPLINAAAPPATNAPVAKDVLCVIEHLSGF